MDAAAIQKLLEGPGLKPPPGVESNFVNPSIQFETNIVINSLCLAVATVCVFLRAYTKFLIMRSHSWEDYTCFIAYIGLVVYVTLMFMPIFRNYAGVHQWDIQGKNLQPWIKIANGIEIAYSPIIFIAKLSILLMYLRIFVVPGKRSKTYWAIQSLIIFNALFYFSNIPIEIWPCLPRRKLWMPTIPGKCINNEAVFVSGGAINMITDFVILAIPIVLVWRLHMPLRRRIEVCAVFAAGIFGCIASILHLTTSVTAAHTKDKTYYLFPVALWTLVEITSAIVVSCLVTMPNFFRYMTPKFVSKLSLSRYTGDSSRHSHNKMSSFVPERANPESWAGTVRHSYDVTSFQENRDSYMELGESGGWASDKPMPAAIHSQGRVRGDTERDGRPVASIPANITMVQGGKGGARVVRAV